jgi:hypothetical protein
MNKINSKRQSIINPEDIKKSKNRKSMIISNQKNSEKEKNKYIYLTDYELNTLIYKDALKIDKRTYIQYYLSLIKTKHAIVFTFINYNDYNSLIIKINFFFFSFTLYLTINALFFSEETVNKIDDDGGTFNLNYQLPQIVYSSLISSVMNMIVKTLCLTERNIILMKQEQPKNLKKKKVATLKCIKMKSIIYFISTFVLLLFFWYYLSCFCAIYKNTQLHLIKDSLISYAFSMVYPFAIFLLPGLFRIPALRNAKGDKETMFKISKILQLI